METIIPMPEVQLSVQYDVVTSLTHRDTEHALTHAAHARGSRTGPITGEIKQIVAPGRGRGSAGEGEGGEGRGSTGSWGRYRGRGGTGQIIGLIQIKVRDLRQC